MLHPDNNLPNIIISQVTLKLKMVKLSLESSTDFLGINWYQQKKKKIFIEGIAYIWGVFTRKFPGLFFFELSGKSHAHNLENYIDKERKLINVQKILREIIGSGIKSALSSWLLYICDNSLLIFYTETISCFWYHHCISVTLRKIMFNIIQKFMMSSPVGP